MLVEEFIEKSILNGMHNNTARIFNRSQDTAGGFVPVLAGNLKSSGVVASNGNKSTIKYTADYAAAVERGSEEREINTVQQVYVPAYRRNNGTVVKGHHKTVKGKIVTFRTKGGEEITRTITFEKERKGQFFTTRAIKQEIPKLVDDIVEQLKKGGSGINIKKITITR